MRTVFTLAFLILDQHTAEQRAADYHRQGDHAWAAQFDGVAILTERTALETDVVPRRCRIPSYLD